MRAPLAGFAALLLSAPPPAHADTTASVATPESPVASAAAGSDAPVPAAGSDAPVPLGTPGTRALGLVSDIGPANSGVATRPIAFGARLVLDNFVFSGLSIGGEFGFDYSSADGSFYDVGGGPRLGYAIPLGGKLAIWPTVVLAYDAGVVPAAGSKDSQSLQDVRLGVQLPLVMTLGGQTAFELGPIASTDLWRSVAGQDAPTMNIVGLRAGLVGWF